MRIFIAGLVFVSGSCIALAASPTGWSPIIFPKGEYKKRIEAMPIECRPGRPLHVYGNTIRLIDQAERREIRRPVQQIVFGTDDLKTDCKRNPR